MSEFNEPWSVIDTPEKCWIHDASDRYIVAAKFPPESLQPHNEREANAARIVACVNALAGIPTEEINERLIQLLHVARRRRFVAELDGVTDARAGDVIFACNSLSFSPLAKPEDSE